MLIVLIILTAWIYGRSWWVKRVPAPTAELAQQAAKVRILRDEWGIPHIFGKTDADTAFGLAYAHAEDDFATIQETLASGRGSLSLLELSKKGIGNDYYSGMFRIREEGVREYERQLSPATRALLEGYARGLTYYAMKHPNEADGRLMPYRGIDIATGFAHRLPMFEGLLQQMLSLRGESFNPEEVVFISPSSASMGSNAHAVASGRSADRTARLNVNSHQPWTGSVAWYEAHLHSEEGWNMTGGLFPGTPLVLLGHNDHLGWAHTVNRPDLVDTYRLEVDPSDASRYRVDGQWLKFEEWESPISVDLKLFTFTYHARMRESIFGPVMQTDKGTFSFRVAGRGQLMKAVEQWYRMNKASNFGQWQNAMRMQAIPMFHTIYTDARNIFYVHNGLLPLRQDGFQYSGIVPGNTRKSLWTRYLPYDQLPSVLNPPSGFVQNCNSSPYRTTTGPGNPDRARFSPNFGINERMTNRAIRSLELFGGDTSISMEEFFQYKFDRQYSRRAPIFSEAVDILLTQFQPRSEFEKEGIRLLKSWDGRVDDDSRAALLAILTWRPIWRSIEIELSKNPPDPVITFRRAMEYLIRHYGKLDVPLSQAQRLRRGNVDLPLGGGPDILNAVYFTEKEGRLEGWAGDCYIIIVEFAPDGVRSWSLHQYGESNHPDSKHYSDQASMFTQRLMRKTLRSEAKIREHLEREYHPGE